MTGEGKIRRMGVDVGEGETSIMHARLLRVNRQSDGDAGIMKAVVVKIEIQY